MKKKLIALFIMVVMVLASVVGLVACDPSNPDNPNPGPSGGKTNIKVWVSELEGVVTATKTKIDAFFNAHTDYKDKYTVTVEGVPEGEAATNMTQDVASGADIFCFAQDQLGRLYEANALSKLGNAGKTAVQLNDAGSVGAVTIDGNMYAYPLTSDNTYFMYYDKRVITEDKVGSLNKIVEACQAAGKNISFQVGGSAWYTASFFFGAGANSSWTLDSNKKWKANDNFNSDKGLIALEGLQIMTQSGVWVDSQNASDFGAASPSAVVVSGTWDSGTAQEQLGENLGIAKLPAYTVGGKDYQLKSFMGYKLMGVKNHTDANVHAFCHELAIFLSGKECQEDRLDKFNWGPSNKELQASDKVKTNDILKAVAEQAQYSVVQGQIHGGWWDFAKKLGSSSKDAAATTEARQKILDAYTADLEKYEKMTDEDMAAWGLIGSIACLQKQEGQDAPAIVVTSEQLASGQTAWGSWSSDLKMVKQADGTYKSVIALNLADGDQFKLRQGQSWSKEVGGPDGNFKITAETAGLQYVVLTFDENGNGTISLVAAQ